MANNSQLYYAAAAEIPTIDCPDLLSCQLSRAAMTYPREDADVYQPLRSVGRLNFRLELLLFFDHELETDSQGLQKLVDYGESMAFKASVAKSAGVLGCYSALHLECAISWMYEDNTYEQATDTLRALLKLLLPHFVRYRDEFLPRLADPASNPL